MASLEETAIGADEKRRVLEEVLKSQTFARSDQLKRFLRYICEKEIAGKADEINEYSIGIEALGKSSAYSPGEDSSVRTRAYALRQKLHEYYELENPQSEIRIEVPRGSYTPHFLMHSDIQPTVALETGTVDISTKEVAEPRRHSLVWSFLAGVGVCGLLAGVLLLVIRPWRAENPSSTPDPLVQAAWGTMLTPGEHVYVCLATPPALLLHSYRNEQLPAIPNMMATPKEVSSWYDTLQMLDGGGKLYMHTTQDAVLFGDSLAANSAVRLLSASGATPQVVPEYDLRPFALRGRNVVVIGSPNYSPFAGRVLRDAPFSVRYEPETREEVISSNPSAPGPPKVFRPKRNEFKQLTTAYGLITILPSQGSGEGQAQTIIFSGITSAGPQAAMEFFKSSSGVHELMARLQKEGHNKFPPMYQVVVNCDLDHNLALNWSYVTHVVITNTSLLD